MDVTMSSISRKMEAGRRCLSTKYLILFYFFHNRYDEYDNYYNADGEPEEEEESYDDDGDSFLLP